MFDHRARELADSQQKKVNAQNATSFFYYKDGILYRSFHSPQVEHDNDFHQVVVPEQYRIQVMRLAHETLLGGHQGAKKTYYTKRVCNMYLCLKGPDENQQMLIGLPFLKM